MMKGSCQIASSHIINVPSKLQVTMDKSSFCFGQTPTANSNKSQVQYCHKLQHNVAKYYCCNLFSKLCDFPAATERICHCDGFEGRSQEDFS